MTHPQRIVHRNIDTAMHRLAVAEKLAPNVLDDIEYRRQHPDRGHNETGITAKGGHNDPTAELAAMRSDLSTKTQRIVRASDLVLRALDHFDACCRDGLGRKVVTAEDAQRCPGYPVGEECGDLIGYSVDDKQGIHLDSLGYCPGCRKRHDQDERRARDAQRQRNLRHDPTRKTA